MIISQQKEWLESLSRFRQVPTFGRGTIRRFGNNVAGMKKLAARDFEDILQVKSLFMAFPLILNISSVSFRFSRASCPHLTMRSSWISYLSWQHGTHMPNCGFTPRRLFIFSKLQLKVWRLHCAPFSGRHVK